MRQLSLILFLSFCSLLAFGQRQQKNLPHYDERPFDFGFAVGLNYYDFRMIPIRDLAGLEGYYNWETTVQPGYTISIISKLRLSEHWELRFTPGFASTERILEFDVVNRFTQNRMAVERKIQSAFLDFPFHFKFRSDRIDNYRLYLLGGLKYSLDLSSDEDVRDDRVFKLRQNDYYYEFGFGVDIYFEYFKFSPQIIASFGLNNQRVEDGTFLVEGLQGVQTRAILINLTFE